jgi:glycosyltransferase involved in cell wall biosynthesis
MFNLDKEKLMKHVLESISIFKIVKKDIRKKLEKINPSTVIIRGAYGRFQMGVTQACHELGIPAVEIQHGLIYEESFPYIKRTKSENYDCIPDTLLTWGEFFSDIVKKGYSFKRNKVISVGFPYLEKMVTNEYSKDSKLDEFRKRFKTVILVAGQSLESIDDFVRNAAEKNTDVGYIYKPHPRDERDITFSQNNVVVVERCIDIYSLFQYVDFTFSSSSTIMFESLAFGIPSVCTSVDIDIRHTGIIDNEAIYLIDTADEFLGVVSKVKENRVMIRKNAERFFKRNALSNIKEIIK